MSVETRNGGATPGSATPAEELRSRALDLLKTHALEVILESDDPLRTADLARHVHARLDLPANEEELGGLASLLRMVLDSDPIFSQSNRQWDLALRMGRAEADRRKPVERAIEDFIDLLGHPSAPRPVSVLVAAVYGREPEYYERMIERLASTRPQFFQVPGGTVGITRWLLDISSDDPEDVAYDNFENPDELDALRPLADAADRSSPAAYARSIIRGAPGPVNGRQLLYFVWAAFPDSEAQALFNDLYADPSLQLGRGPSWSTQEGHRQLLDTVREFAREPEAASGLLATSAAAVTTPEEAPISVLAPTVVRVSDDDLDQVYEFMSGGPRGAEGSWKLPELCQQVLEAFPGSRTYPGIYESLRGRMREDSRFLWVGAERFRLSGTVPPEVETLPEGLKFDEREYFGEEGAEVDRMVDPRDWKFNLDQQVAEYLVQDLGDDQTPSPSKLPDRIVTSPPLHHYVEGTLYLRNSDRGFFPPEPDLVQVSLVTGDANRFDAWFNNRLGLLYGIKEWYDANLPFVGGRFAIERTSQPDEFQLVYEGETEPLMDIPGERMQALLMLRGEAASEGLPLAEILQRVLKAHAEGVHFVTLFTEINIVRRVRRAQVASAVSSQRFASQSPTRPGIWSYDEKRAAKATKKKGGPRRPMREYDDDSDEEFEIE